MPAEIVSFEVESDKKISEPPARIETPPPVEAEEIAHAQDVEEPEEIVGEDEFSSRERQKFAEVCPDINLETALKYCMDSKSFLQQMLTTFTDAKRVEKIQAAFDSGDVKNYQILVHALKSTSLSIGAENLSEQAKSLEMAAKENNVEEIQANHGDLMSNYEKVRDEISKWLEASA